MIFIGRASGNSGVLAAAIAVLFGACRSNPPVQPPVELPARMVLDVRCASGLQTDTVRACREGFEYQLLEGRRSPGKRAWVDDRSLRVRISGFRPESLYMIALSAWGEELFVPRQRVVIAGRTVRGAWKVELEPVLGTVMLTELHVVESPVSFPAGSVDLDRCPPYERLTVRTAMRRLATGGPPTVTVDAQQSVRRFNRVWEGVNGVSPRAGELGMRTVRLDGEHLFAGAFPAPGIYRWRHVDMTVERVLACGAVPLVAITTVPEWLWPPGTPNQAVLGPGTSSRPVGSIMPPRDLDAWAELVYQTVRHLNIERGYGVRYFEVWHNPADERFWRGTIDRYIELYEATVRAVKRADRSMNVGGPAVAGYQPDWIEALMRCAADRRIPLDFVSWDCYTARPELYRRQIAYTRQLGRRLGLRPAPALVISEWGYGRRSDERETFDGPFAASYAATAIHEMDKTGLDLAHYCAIIDGLRPGAYTGLLRQDGTPKPVYALFKMLSLLGTHELDTGLAGGESGIGAVAGEGRSRHEIVAIIWWWLDDTPTAAGVTPVRFAVEHLPADETYRWEFYVIDDNNSNFAVGSDRAELTLVSVGDVPRGADRFELDTSLPVYGVQMVRLVPRKDNR